MQAMLSLQGIVIHALLASRAMSELLATYDCQDMYYSCSAGLAELVSLESHAEHVRQFLLGV